jgi:tetratricopeptide (TPR) repeat protein
MKAFLAVACAALALGMHTAAAVDSSPDPVSALQSRDPDYEAGRSAIEARNWKAALEHFNRSAGRDPRNADTQNMLGYAHRQAGNMELALKHYREALRLDPSHRGAHEYIGEAYLRMGDLASAEQHLAALDRLCFFSCEEYRDLKRAVEAFRKTKLAPSTKQ